MPNPEFATLEEAREEIIRLRDELSTAITERENYSNRVNELTETLEKVRELNQRYFLRLSGEPLNIHQPGNDDDPDVPTCEEFASTLTI